MHSRVFYEAGIECNERAAARARARGADSSIFDALAAKYRHELENYNKPRSRHVQPRTDAPADGAWLTQWLERASPWLQAHVAGDGYRMRLALAAPRIELAYETRIRLIERLAANDQHIEVRFPTSASHERAVSYVLNRN